LEDVFWLEPEGGEEWLSHPKRIEAGWARGQGKFEKDRFTRVREWLEVTPKSPHATVTGLPVLILYKERKEFEMSSGKKSAACGFIQ
jgi:hypothetical protein